MNEIFTGSFTQQEPIPEEAIKAAVAVLKSGRLHRYNTASDEAGEVALLEQEFAAEMRAKYCLAVASGGYAMTTALRAIWCKTRRPGAYERIHFSTSTRGYSRRWRGAGLYRRNRSTGY